MDTDPVWARLCRIMLVSASATAKYAADSTGVRPPRQVDVDGDRDRQAERQCADRAGETAFGEHRWVNAPDEVPQLDQCGAAGLTASASSLCASAGFGR